MKSFIFSDLKTATKMMSKKTKTIIISVEPALEISASKKNQTAPHKSVTKIKLSVF
ncbi:Uncharacterised protein [Streptococcus pneumoniae]|nr:Uncharacterised protein [Streptococcus pneumoniae]